MSGKRTGMREYSQSTAANIAQPKNSTPMVSAGASDDVVGALDDDPTCRHTTVPVSAQAAHERIPVAGVQRRQPEPFGQLGERHRVEAALGVARGSRPRRARGRAATAAGTG